MPRAVSQRAQSKPTRATKSPTGTDQRMLEWQHMDIYTLILVGFVVFVGLLIWRRIQSGSTPSPSPRNTVRNFAYALGAVVVLGIGVHFASEGKSTQTLLVILGQEPTTNAFVSKCISATGASSSDCQCAASAARDIMSIENWKTAGAIFRGDRHRAETDIAKAGLINFTGSWANAASAAERRCGIRGLARM